MTERERKMPSKVPVGVYQIKITLKGMKPPIWRRVTVPGDITLAGLHEVIQRAMGWMNCHLHEFVIHGERYGSAASEASDFKEDLVDEVRAHLNKVSGPGKKSSIPMISVTTGFTKF